MGGHWHVQSWSRWVRISHRLPVKVCLPPPGAHLGNRADGGSLPFIFFFTGQSEVGSCCCLRMGLAGGCYCGFL